MAKKSTAANREGEKKPISDREFGDRRFYKQIETN